MPGRSCDILVYTLRQGDATSQHTFELARILADMGIRPAIHSNYRPGDLPADIAPVAHHTSYASYRPQADLTILQYPLWFPLTERFRTARGARLFWYHGVTPPEHWSVADERDLLTTSQVRTELANFAHLSAAASPFTAEELHAHSAYPRDRIRVVPLGVDTQLFSSPPDRALLSGLRDQWRLEGKRVLLYVGRIAGNKRIDMLIDVLALLHTQFPDLHLLVVGDRSNGLATQALAADLSRQARSHGVADRVTFTGRVPHVAPYYHLTDLFVLPSQHEGFGVPLVEAMAAGVPVIASASGAMPWLLNTPSIQTEQMLVTEDVAELPLHAAGLLFEPGHTQQLAAQVSALLMRQDMHRSLVARGRRRAQDFSRQAFRARAGVVLCEALEMSNACAGVPEEDVVRSALYQKADTIQRDYTVTSRRPVLGRYVAALRSAATVHLKDAYFDRVMERQINFNRMLAGSIAALEQQVSDPAVSSPQSKSG